MFAEADQKFNNCLAQAPVADVRMHRRRSILKTKQVKYTLFRWTAKYYIVKGVIKVVFANESVVITHKLLTVVFFISQKLIISYRI